MWNAKTVNKNFSASADPEAEKILHTLLAELHDALEGKGISLYLGGSYGRGEGGVRTDRAYGVLYNDLDFFAFARKAEPEMGKILREKAEHYEKLLHVDIDFSTIMSVRDIKKNASRLMMQELKQGYRLVCGEDLLEAYLPEIPADRIPFSEACRLLLNRGMGLLLAKEKLENSPEEADFILRNIYKGLLGAGDAVLISRGLYRWRIGERLEAIRHSDLKKEWIALYEKAVDFKRFPGRRCIDAETGIFWKSAREFFLESMRSCAGTENGGQMMDLFYKKCHTCKELSLMNFAKYCIKGRTFPLKNWKYYRMPPVVVLLAELYRTLHAGPCELDRNGRLFRSWTVFN